MANFHDHLYFGMTSSIIGATLGYAKFGLTTVQSAAAFVIGTLASLAPDIDLPSSTPGQLLFTSLGIIVPVAGFHYYPEYAQGFKLEHWIVVLAAGYIFVRHILSMAFDKIVVHRGMFHSIPAIFISGEITFLLLGSLPLQQRTVISVIAMAGYLTHLIADEVYSVDWSGQKLSLKRSAGSAIDFGKTTKLSTWVAYILFFALGWIIYKQVLPNGIVIG